MAHDNCTICNFELRDTFDSCPACDAADAIILGGYAHSNYHEELAGKIGDLLKERDWQRTINLNKMFQRQA